MMYQLIKKHFFSLIVISVLSSPAVAKKAGIVTMIKGPVEIFIKPSLAPDTSKPSVKFENKFYIIKKARVGTKLMFNQVIKTGAGSKLKINFLNGDTMMIGPGTAYSLHNLKGSIKERKKKLQMINLIYGKIRAVISKTGPRSNMKVKTKVAVAGIRGTDFYIAYNPSEEASSVDVLRGKVAVSTSEKAKPKMVQKGFRLKVKYASKVKKHKVRFRPISKEKLAEIQKETKIRPVNLAMVNASEETKVMMRQLEIKSKKMILEDIKADDPNGYEQIAGEAGKMTAEELNNKVINDLSEKAPTEPELSKITEEELRNSLENQEDAYKKYFR